MSLALNFAIDPEILDEGSAEERATFGRFTIQAGESFMTEGFDAYVNALRSGPLVSGYPVAEWLAWNWWRLRWEPRGAGADWALAHVMSSIGGGWIWPNITIFSDGERTALISKHSAPNARPYRYMGTVNAVLPSRFFEAATDQFVGEIIAKLGRPQSSNLHKIWNDLVQERREPELAKRRRLEALMSRDPDEHDDGEIERLLGESLQLGDPALDEIAAERGKTGDKNAEVLSAEMFRSIAEEAGYSGSVASAVTLNESSGLPRGPTVAAWRFGAEAAKALRAQEHLGSQWVESHKLAEMAGVGVDALKSHNGTQQRISFAFTEKQETRFVLRSRWRTGRRFDLARLIGDRIIAPVGPLQPATKAYTYRQKAQRSFAAEFLCPFEDLSYFLNGDYSPDSRDEAAEHFEVSPMAIETLLLNHGRLEREPYLEEFENVA